MHLVRVACFAAALVAALAAPSAAFVDPGQVAPAFTKNVLGGVPPTLSLSDFAGKVVVIHVMGYA